MRRSPAVPAQILRVVSVASDMMGRTMARGDGDWESDGGDGDDDNDSGRGRGTCRFDAVWRFAAGVIGRGFALCAPLE